METVTDPYVDPDKFAPGALLGLPPHIEVAIKLADRSKFTPRNWRPLPMAELTDAESAMMLLERLVRVPSGKLVGAPLRFLFFQEVIFYILLDARPKTFILSMARRNGKSFILSCLVLLHLISWMAVQNSVIASAAMSRDQAGLIYKEIENIIRVSPALEGLLHTVPSGKRIVGLRHNAEYSALSSEAKTGFGRSYKVIVLDEAGQIIGPDSDYVSMLRTSQGSVEDPVFAVISTQAASDADFLSIQIDSAIRDAPEGVACLLFETPKEFDLDDEEGWVYSNPGLGVFRSIEDMRQQVGEAKRIPAQESKFRNLSLNQRIAREGVWMTPDLWKINNGGVDLEAFQGRYIVACGLDLSTRNDLTAAVFACRDDDGFIHLLPRVYVPANDLHRKVLADKVPYDAWVDSGHLVAVPGTFISYEYVAADLAKFCQARDIQIDIVAFDRWRISYFQPEAEKVGFADGADWRAIGQGFKDMSPRLEMFEGLASQGMLCHGNHPLLNMAAATAIAVRDPSGNRKLDKSRSYQRIDPLVAAVMAVGEVAEGSGEAVDVSTWIVV
jgi:phage terminase large subunit-like protein